MGKEAPTRKEAPALEVAHVIRRFGDAFRQVQGNSLTSQQRRALRDLVQCRTKALGGHLQECACCGWREVRYNSCRNRHCPKCHGAAQARWYTQQQAHLLPCEYFHVVFTLPQEVNRVALLNPVALYSALFTAASETVRVLAADPKHLGAQVGTLFLLHTWGQQLQFHPHLHGIITGGGLSCDATGKLDTEPTWVSCRKGFFLLVRVLSRLYRGKFCALMETAYQEGRLLGFAKENEFREWLRSLFAQEWVVYAKAPMAGPEVVLKYLARYTHRVALANERLLHRDDHTVTFTYKDYRQQAKRKTLTLTGVEFLRRWVQHVLPRGFVKIRHYGLLANRFREEKLSLCRQLLLVWATLLTLCGLRQESEPRHQGPRCAQCGGREWLIVEKLTPPTYPFSLILCGTWDSS